MGREPKVGDVAVCGNKLPGLITEVSNCELGTLYRGIHLSPDKFGQSWETTNPYVIGNLYNLVVYTPEVYLGYIRDWCKP
jgi:hypothetical protein